MIIMNSDEYQEQDQDQAIAKRWLQKKWKEKKIKNCERGNLTFRRIVSAGLRSVSLRRSAGRFFGFELGVWTAQHLMNTAMNSIMATIMSMQAHQ